jgi:hypothetical protein
VNAPPTPESRSALLRVRGIEQVEEGLLEPVHTGVEAINTAIEAGARAANILVRGDSACCARKIIAAIVKAEARFSFAIARNAAVDTTIATIPDEAYKPVQYPGAVLNTARTQVRNASCAHQDLSCLRDGRCPPVHG